MNAPLPPPTITLSLPSLHDSTPLAVHLHLPSSQHQELKSPEQPSRVHQTLPIAVLAHPYAPLGGSLHDPINSVIAASLLRKGFGVCLFNFRGAASSPGHTSWTGTPETHDFLTAVLFTLRLLVALFPPTTSNPARPPCNLTLLLGGYSYGSQILRRLPPLADILPLLQPTGSATVHSAHHRSRRHGALDKLALGDVIASAIALAHQLRTDPTHEHVLLMGGGEAERRWREKHRHGLGLGHRRTVSAELRGVSVEGVRRSVDGVRKSIDGVRRSVDGMRGRVGGRVSLSLPDGLAGRKEGEGQRVEESIAGEEAEIGVALSEQSAEKHCLLDLPNVNVAYLLVSPVLGPASHATCLPLGRDHDAEKEAEIHGVGSRPTLVVYGDKDGFTSGRRVKAWCMSWQGQNQRFEATEVRGAGHFWVEEGTGMEMVRSVEKWAEELVESN